MGIFGSSRPKRFTQSLVVSATVFAPLFLFGPLEIFCANQDDLRVGILNFAHFLVAPAIACLIFATLLLLLSVYLSERLRVLILALGICLYFQNSFLVWDYGLIDGQLINWKNFSTRGVIDLSAWLILLVVTQIFHRFFLARAGTIAGFLLLVQLVSLAPGLLNKSTRWQSQRQSVDTSSMYRFSRESNLIVIILDGFQSPLFQRILNQDSQWTNAFSGFTYYRNTLASFATTAPSIPMLLSGKETNNSLPLKDFYAQALSDALPVILKTRGFQADVVSLPQICPYLSISNCTAAANVVQSDYATLELREYAQLLDLSLFRHAPQFLKRQIYQQDEWLVQRLVGKRTAAVHQADALDLAESVTRNAEATADRPTYKFFHFLLPHPPFRFDRNCRAISKSDLRARAKAKQKVDAYAEQARCALLMTSRILERLRTIGVYDRSTIVISADHGSRQRYLDYKKPQAWAPLEQGLPLLLLKIADGRGSLQTSSRAASLRDIVPTLADVAAVPLQLPGRSLLQSELSSTEPRSFFFYRWEQGNWRDQYLPKMQEYVVTGDAWELKNWTQGRSIMAPAVSK